jgi:hypothetical protein
VAPDPSLQLISDEISHREVNWYMLEFKNLQTTFNRNYQSSERAGTTRVEIFHMTTDPSKIVHTPVQQYPFHKMMNCFATEHINSFMVSHLESAMKPLLQTFLDGTQGLKDLHGLSMEAKVSLMYQLEVMAQMLSANSYTSPVLSQVPKVRDRPIVLSVPGSMKVPITPQEMEMTGLSYGLKPCLLKCRRNLMRNMKLRVPPAVFEDQQRFNMYCLSMNKLLRLSRSYVNAETKLIKVLRDFTNPGVSLDEMCVFLTPDYPSLRALSESMRESLYDAICPIAWGLYTEEWGSIVSKQSEKYFKQRNSQPRRGQVTRLKPDQVPTCTSDVRELTTHIGPFAKIATDSISCLELDCDGCLPSIGKERIISMTVTVSKS